MFGYASAAQFLFLPAKHQPELIYNIDLFHLHTGN